MADVVFVGVMIAFFALAVLLVRACEAIIGSDEETTRPSTGEPAPAEELAA
jgi:hypothetical protein